MDIGSALGWLTQVCIAVLDWITAIFDSITGSHSFYVAMVTMFISTGLLLIPLRAGRGKVSLYKKKECIEKNIPEEQAVEKLIELIRSNGDYIEK